jgi:hypothetical protein
VIAIAWAVARSPRLWPTAVRQVRRLAARGWWRRWPFLPLPPRSYLRFRLLTQYGDASHDAQRGDVLNYLRWCQHWDRVG